MTKSTMTNECTLSAGHFDGHGGVPEQYRWHCLMWHFQGYSGSHWTLPSGNYLLCIAPVAARATGKQTTIKKIHLKRWPFWWPWQWRMSRASLEATGRRHRASIMSNNINRTWLRRFFNVFIVKTVGNGHGLTLRPLFLIGVWHINQNRRAWLRWVYIVLGGV